MTVVPRKFSAANGDDSTGTVSLVALCFVAVLGIVLASYLAVCSRAMNLSNRSYQSSLSQQLAEFGLEEGLRAFNKNDWVGWASNPSGISGGTTVWTLDATNKRASRKLTFDATKLGQGATATIKIRIDNYDQANLNSNWSSTTTYRINDLVGYNGTWYRCVRDNSFANIPGTIDYEWWVPVPLAWAWNSNQAYTANYDVICDQGVWRLCTTTHTSGSTFNASNWTSLAAPSLAWTSSTSYGAGALVYRPSNNTWYRCTTPHTSGGSFDGTKFATASWSYDSSISYSFDDIVQYGVNWYRYINSIPTSGTTPSPGSYWENARSGPMQGWSNAGLRYNIGDIVYYSTTSQWYRCIQAHTSSSSLAPTNANYWSNAPVYSTAWNSNQRYTANDTARYNGEWYLSLTTNSNSNPVTSTINWASAANSSYSWNSTTAYTTGNYVSYGKIWYKCSASNTGRAPNNTAYWTPTWTNSAGITTGAPIIYAEASIILPNNPPALTQLRAVINPASLFPNAMAGSGTISLNTGGTIDSYDSTLADYVAPGGYSAVVASSSTASPAVTVTSTTIQGYVAAPSANGVPLTSFGPSAIVKGTSATPSPKPDPARISRSPYVPQFSPLPSGGLTAAFASSNFFPKGTLLQLPASGSANTLNIGTPGGTIPSRYYYDGDLTISDTAAVRVLNINGPVILYINGDLILDGDGTAPDGMIQINSAGSAEIHVAGGLKVYQNSDGFNNTTSDPKKLSLICDTALGTAQIYSDGGHSFYGTIYMPNSSHASGLYSNNSSVKIFGAVSAKNITFDQDANIHYDTSLRYVSAPGVDQPYTVTEWRDLPLSEQATMP